MLWTILDKTDWQMLLSFLQVSISKQIVRNKTQSFIDNEAKFQLSYYYLYYVCPTRIKQDVLAQNIFTANEPWTYYADKE